VRWLRRSDSEWETTDNARQSTAIGERLRRLEELTLGAVTETVSSGGANETREPTFADWSGALKEVRAPDLTYRDRLTLTLGGKSVELIHTGTMTHTDDMSLIHFPDARAIYLVDWVSPGRLPFATLGTGNLDGWLNAIRMAEMLDYDIAAGAHGIVGDKSHVTAFRHYLEELRDQVAAGIAEGRSMEELQASILMEPYQGWQNYEVWRPLNVEGMYNMLAQ